MKLYRLPQFSTNEQIIDFIGGSTASSAFKLDDEDKIRNAQYYAWSAAVS